MKITKVTSGLAQENGYVFSLSGQAVIIDPGSADERFIEAIERAGTPLAILLTHAHFDHIGGIDWLRDRYDIPVYVHRAESDWLMDDHKNGAAAFNLPYHAMRPAERFYAGTPLEIGPFRFDVMHTPGHSPGSVVLCDRERNIAFCGDLIFKQSVGRTDLYGGDQGLLFGSIEKVKHTLPAETLLYPGHGPKTTLASEIRDNPFF